MCKQLKGILWPLNLLGKKMRSIKIDLPSGFTTVNLNVQWEGERIDVAYTRFWRPPSETYGKYEPMRETLTDGDGSVDTVSIIRASHLGQRVGCDVVYFKCTNVTSLIINGERYI